jgi:transposase
VRLYLRVLLLLAFGRPPDPTTAIIDSRTLRSSQKRGTHAGYDGGKRKRRCKVDLPADTLGHLLGLRVTLADIGDRTVVNRLAANIQDATGSAVTLAYVNQGYTGEVVASAAAAGGTALTVLRLPEARSGFVLLPKRWVVERSIAWATRCCRQVTDHER